MRHIRSGAKRRNEIAQQLAVEESKASLPRVFSKLKIYVACAKAQIWDKVEKWMSERTVEGVNMLKAYNEAQQISDDHPLFMDCIGRLQADLNLSNELVLKILAECVA